jgi:hypothetical protein
LGGVRGEGCLGGAEEYREEEIVGGVIGGTLPTGWGQRHSCLFVLARRLKALPQFTTASAEELLPIVSEWYRLALPHIRTKDWRVTWADFADGWRRVRSPGEGAILTGIRGWVASHTDDALLRLELAAEALHARQDGQPFYLACRTAGDLIGTSRTTAAKLLKRLIAAGVLGIVKPADNSARHATTYTFRGPSIITITNSTKGFPA